MYIWKLQVTILETDMFTRYAVYFSPIPNSPLAKFGNSWLGWDINSAVMVERPNLHDFSQSIESLTESPQKYGFHGTLKAPFYLRDGIEIDELHQFCISFAKARTPFVIGRLQISCLGNFLALTEREPSADLAQLAGDIVVEFDKFRAPQTEKEIARRLKSNLSRQQEHLMHRWGYPYVLDEFRFHLTLTGRLRDAEIAGIQHALTLKLMTILADPITVGDICLCGQRHDERFEIITRFPLGG